MQASLDNALSSFKSRLAMNGYSDNITWVFREDLKWSRRRLFLYLGGLQDNLRIAQHAFGHQYARKYGIEISLLVSFGGRSYCTLFLPQSSREAEQMMIGGLKTSIPINLPKCEVVSSEEQWKKIRIAEVPNLLSFVMERRVIETLGEGAR